MPLRIVIPNRPPVWWQSLLWAVGLSCAAWAFRAMAAPLMLSNAPYIACFAAVLAATLWGGRLGGAVTALLSGLMANWAFVATPNRFELSGPYLWSLLAFYLMAAFVITLGDTMAAAVRREAALREQLEVTSQEFQHRAKNAMTLVVSLIHQTGRNAVSVADFQSKLIDRFQALGRAQTVLDQSAGKPASLTALIEEVTAPFDVGGRVTGNLVGTDVGISRETAIGLGLVLHELATNATKYGALSVPTGSVSLRWTVGKGTVSLLWQEHDGPLVKQPSRSGFGSRVFKRALPDGRVEVSFDPAGIKANVVFTAEQSAPPVV